MKGVLSSSLRRGFRRLALRKALNATIAPGMAITSPKILTAIVTGSISVSCYHARPERTLDHEYVAE